MKNLSFSLFNVLALFSVILMIILIVLPFNLINLEQAERIAKWKSEYEKLNYSFSLVGLHEGKIIPTETEAGKIITDEFILQFLSPYFDLTGDIGFEIPKYKYRKMNGQFIHKNDQFYFNKFVQVKNGVLLGIKKAENFKNTKENNKNGDERPLYYMFVDINGKKLPNRIGQDIFFISIFRNHVTALGEGKTHALLKADCSPIGCGLYCSQYYLLGGQF